ncbi:DUF4132 domain-containing protein [Lentzea flava]|uniref:DUF4132 domain-containing protein n=1 Tax=Lentzea flava TaxID=103732 RepID=A0ABQ2UMI9_9PSEU|nr:DUF4132 domain-containing protein [Lentzea flava]MCP2201835.1 protein of unknown function (DUF4132) [Lentzea flava]GGU45011.1 hypothetical protein GCM10010178_41940 [Lentzea flava]
MPKAWLRDALWRRDVEPLPPRFTVSQARAQEFRDWVAANGEEIAEVMAHPMSDQNLVRVLRDQLDGRPTPLGAALLARVAQLHKLSVHWWIAEYGLPFAAAAVVHCCAVVLLGYHNSQTDRSFKARLESAEGRHPDPTDVDGWNLVQIRTALAAADAATYDAAIAELEKVGTTALGQVARAFLVPTRHDWFEEANAHPPRRPGNWMTLGAVSTLEQLARLQSRDLTWSPIALHTALHALGPAIAPFVAEEFDDSRSDADRRRLALKVLAALPTDEAFAILLDRLDTKYVRPVLLSAMAAFPARAARLLAARAATNAEALQLLRAHLMSHPDLEPPTETAALLAEAEARMVPDAPASALPRVLAEAPWSHPRPQPKPLVLKDLPVPDAHISWLPGEREEWLGNGSHRVVELAAWQRAAEEMRAGRHNHHGLFENGPEELARPLLACWVPGDSWGAEDWGRRIAARFELDALPPLLRLAASNPHGCGMILLPYATAEVANLMANWLVRLKTAGAFAAAWLARHGEAAARLLLPAALGAASPQRGYAEFALRHLHLEIGVDVIAVAAAVRPEAGAAVRTLVEVDPLDVLPTKLPEIGDWADTRLLPQVLLADRTAALSAQAATNLLMTAALSKPDAVYAGLPMAVEVCDRESLAEFAWTVFTRWQAEDAPPKDGWALTALGWFGTDETVRRLAPLIRAWPGENAHAKAVTGLDVLAQIGTETALAHLNGIAEKVKFKALKARAQEKVADIAATLGLSRDQLSDRLVPSLGLDDAASLVIDYGSRQFTVGFDEQLKPYVLDPDGKRRKDLPKPGAKDDQEKAPLEHQRFAALKKDVRTVATDQIQRLERAMIAQRTWSAEEFHTVLAAHPLLWHLVRRLVWITDEGLSFRLAEDRTLANAEDDEITLPGDATVRVAHPVDLADTLEAWGEVFADYEILQPFPQLGRPTHSFAAGEPRVPQLHKYLDLPVPVGKILGLTKRGWVRGTPLDAGVEEWITRPLPAGGALVATLDPGIAVGAIDVFPEVKFTSLYFSATGEGHWTAPRDGGPDTFDVDPVTASELLSELESLHH